MNYDFKQLQNHLDRVRQSMSGMENKRSCGCSVDPLKNYKEMAEQIKEFGETMKMIEKYSKPKPLYGKDCCPKWEIAD